MASRPGSAIRLRCSNINGSHCSLLPIYATDGYIYKSGSLGAVSALGAFTDERSAIEPLRLLLKNPGSIWKAGYTIYSMRDLLSTLNGIDPIISNEILSEELSIAESPCQKWLMKEFARLTEEPYPYDRDNFVKLITPFPPILRFLSELLTNPTLTYKFLRQIAGVLNELKYISPNRILCAMQDILSHCLLIDQYSDIADVLIGMAEISKDAELKDHLLSAAARSLKHLPIHKIRKLLEPLLSSNNIWVRSAAFENFVTDQNHTLSDALLKFCVEELQKDRRDWDIIHYLARFDDSRVVDIFVGMLGDTRRRILEPSQCDDFSYTSRSELARKFLRANMTRDSWLRRYRELGSP